MNTLPSRYRSLALAGALSVLMWLTRGNHSISPTHLPDASWAVFFLVGFYFRDRLLLPLFLAQAVIVDYVAINMFGMDNFCVTPAYLFLHASLRSSCATYHGSPQPPSPAPLCASSSPAAASTSSADALPTRTWPNSVRAWWPTSPAT